MERTLALAVMATLVLLGSALPVRAVTPKEALQRAEIAFADKRYEEAAAHMEDVFRLTSDPQWLARAGYARMLAGQLDLAIADFSQALQATTLTGEVRQRAQDRHAKATLASEHLARSRAEKARGDLAAAARDCDAAYASVPIGAYLLEAASLWEQAGDLRAAEKRYQQAATLDDLTAAQRQQVAESLPRVAKAVVEPALPEDWPPPPNASADNPAQPEPSARAPSTPVLGWTLVATGGAAVALGIAGFVVSEGERSDWKANRDRLSDTQEIAMNDRAETWWNVGLVAGGVGLAATVTGVVLVLTHEDARDTRGTVRVGAHPTSGGALVTALGHF